MSQTSFAPSGVANLRAGNIILGLLRFTLLGVAAALAGVLLHVALKLVG